MGYPKVLSEEQKAVIKPIVEKIDSMKEGDLITIMDQPEALDELRYLIYTWLHHNSIKSIFKVTRPTPDRLCLYRKVLLRPEIESDFVDPRIKGFITSSLLDIEDEDVAISLIRKRFSEVAQRTVAHREWRRIMKGESGN